MKTLDKPRLQQCVALSIVAYGHEDRINQEQEDRDFLDKLSEMGQNLRSGGVVATDTVEIGDVQIHFAVSSPLKITDDGSGTSTVTFSGPFPVEIGITVDESQDEDDDETPEHVRARLRGMIY